MRALISVSDKSGVVEFARALVALDVEIVSTGNTQRLLTEAGIAARAVSEITNFPEILGGRVKTLHPAIHGGILARRDDPAHLTQLSDLEIAPIDIVVVNLYPFRETVAKPQTTMTEAREQIDIGGVALIRAAAKNAPAVLTLIDPEDYPAALRELEAGRPDPDLRRKLAARAFAHTAAYDAAIATYLADTTFPPTLNMAWPVAQSLRYGENPHQPAALYGDFFRHFEQLHGKELSYNNILDTAAAQELIEEFPAAEAATVAIIKHTNPCGVGSAETLLQAWEKAFATDRDAPFGGIISANQTLDIDLARAIDAIFSEIVIAPDFTPEALELLRKKKNRRLLRTREPVTQNGEISLRSVPGGVLAQVTDRAPLADEEQRVVTSREPTAAEWEALRFAWRVVKHVKSNAIVYCASDRTLGIGAGQMSRVDSSRLAVWKAGQAGLSLEGSVVGSDALFPFADGVEAALEAGATAIIQPGGAIRDEDVIAACNAQAAAMVFTGRRHFRH